MAEVMNGAGGTETKAEVGRFDRMMLRGAFAGLLCALGGLGYAGSLGAAGAFAGALAAGLYGYGFIKTHMARAGRHERAFDPAIATHALLRMLVVAAGGAGAFALGVPVLKSYLVAFAISFAAVVGIEIPKASRALRARGVIG